MSLGMKLFLVHVLFLLFYSYLASCTDTLLPGEYLSFPAPHSLVSKQGKFALGFFCPGNPCDKLFIGIWYANISTKTMVWIANRDYPIHHPFNNSRLELADGNLQLLNALKQRVWDTNSSTASTTSDDNRAVLLDSGNLVLTNGIEILWQSFDYPTDTWLPGARIGFDGTKKTLQKLTSWRNFNDPATGNYSLQVDQAENGDLIIILGEEKIWRSGSWNKGGFSSLPQANYSNYAFNFTYAATEYSKYITYNVFGKSGISRIVIDFKGIMKIFFWSDDHTDWLLLLSRPGNQCDDYNICGEFGVCDRNYSPLCECLQGFAPKAPIAWSLRDYSDGCARRTPLKCGSKNVGFARIQNVKLPASSESMQVGNEEICKYICSSNCSYNAYSYSNGHCYLWIGDLFDMERLRDNSRGAEFNLKIFSEPSYNKENKKSNVVALAASIISAIFVGSMCGYILWRRKLKKKGILTKKKFREMLLPESATNWSPGTSNRKEQENQSDIELKFFELQALRAATDNFSPDKKLGEGGFGPVFKGQLPDRQLIAVKRLSTQSRQGITEFKTEALLIAKLQHRNLVRFLGCCVEDEEKMLIYEYMPNKSLDYFIFDESRKSLLDWKKRHEIIAGIARGILYLHQDSRLRIIHRDLKASNILLDEDMNPKISDFGTARIFTGNQNEANTHRIVGTYGYMSPEYALDGLFSVKSDVYSFGVLLLEVISGRKNRVSYNNDSPSNLIRQAWELWNDGNAFELIDPAIVDSCPSEEALRCIQVGLLCLQVNAADRPTMSSVLFMLSNEAMVPSPKQPLITPNSDSSTTDATSSSNNELTITAPDAR